MPEADVIPLRDTKREIDEIRAALSGSLPGGSYTDMTPGEVDAKIAASEARTGEKFAALRGDFRADFESMRGEIKAVAASTSGLKTTVIGTGIAVVAIVIAVLAYGGDRFGAGADISGIIERAAIRAAEEVLPRQNLGVIDAEPITQPSGQ